jgi:putative transposase
MARLARLAVEHQLHYVGQRGHNGAAVIRDAADAHTFLQCLRMEAFGKPLQWHAFALEPGAYHLLVTPSAAGALSTLIQGLGRRYGPYFNRRYSHRGGLWEGRFKTTVIGPEVQLDVMLWMASKSQVAAQKLGLPVAQWGSSPHYQGLVLERGLTPPPRWWQMGNTPFARETAFAQALAQGLGEARMQELDATLGREWVVGNDLFVQKLGALTDRRLRKAKPGRPKSIL